MINPIEIAKAHPWLTGGAVLAAIIVIVLMSSAGGSQAVADTGASEQSQVAAGLQMQQISAAAGARAMEIAAQEKIALETLASTERIEAMKSESAFNANQLASNLGLAQLAATERVQTLESTLEANARIRELEAEETQTKSMFDYLGLQSNLQYQSTLAGYNASIQQAQIAKQPTGLFSFLFG